jgi:hypothetical protein
METLRDRHSDASIVLPLQALGTRYVTAGYNWTDPYEHFVVLATRDGTSVSITPKAMTSGGQPGGQRLDVTLNAGEIYRVRSFLGGLGGSLSGSFIEADGPVAVFSGGESGWIPMVSPDGYGYLNPHYEEMLPIDHLGTQYAAVPYRSRRNGDTFIIVTSENGTTVQLSDGSSRVLAMAGDIWELQLDHPVLIETDRPVLVAQFANSATYDAPENEYGDGSMLVLPPLGRLSRCHAFVSGILGSEELPVPNRAVNLWEGQWLQVRDTPLLAAPVFTAECWIRPDSGGVVVSRSDDDPATSDWELRYDARDQLLEFVTRNAARIDTFRTAPTSVHPGRWTHVALVAHGPAGRAEVYINGNRGTSATFTSRTFDARTGLAWGGVFNRDSRATYRGLIDECRYWDTERTRDQLNAAMQSRLPDGDRNGLIGYWSFCQDLMDESGNYHTLTAMNGSNLENVFDLPPGLDCTEILPDSSFVNIAVPAGGESEVRLNGVQLDAAAFAQVPNAAWYYTRQQVPAGRTTVGSTDARGMAVTAYGFATHDAYSYLSSYLVRRTISALNDALPSAFELQVYPQPIRGAAVVRFTLPSAGRVDLALYDQLGRRVLRLTKGDYVTGTHAFALRMSDLPAGAYHLVLSSGVGRVVKTVLHIH